MRDAQNDPDVVTFVGRPQRQLHQLLHHRLRLLRLLPPPDGPRGLRPPEVGASSARSRRRSTSAARRCCSRAGHHPNLRIEWYEDLFGDIKSRYPIHLHALSPSEILHIAHVSRIDLDETMERLRAAGHDSLPGGGAEILVDRVRQVIAPRKTTTDEWLGVMRAAHRAGMSTTATMMYGTVDTVEDRVEHLRRLREVQDEIRRLPRLRLLELPVRRRQRARRRPRPHDGRRLPDDARRQPPLPRQLPPLPVARGSPRGCGWASSRWSSAATTWARS